MATAIKQQLAAKLKNGGQLSFVNPLISMGGGSTSVEPKVVDMKESEQQQEVEDELYCTVKSDVVGIQYYNGMVSNNEMVTLIREPLNKYDCNAIKVENTGGEQVGHIKREDARVLSSLMDSALARVEGIIPFGANNKFRIPIHIFVWGEPAKKESTVNYLRSSDISFDLSSAQTKRNKVNVDLSILGGFAAMDYGHVVTSRTLVTPAEMENELDKMFETLDEGDKTTEEDPCAAIATKLYPHQKQALNWMKCKENKDDLPPFWEQRGSLYVNTLTMFQTHGRPRKVCGGILADDMGLGKTLEIISLIMTNFVDGKPLAYPVPGHSRLAFDSSKKFSGKKSIENSSAKKVVHGGKSDPKLILSPKTVLSKSATTVNDSSVHRMDSVLTGCEVPSNVMVSKEDPDYAQSMGAAPVSRKHRTVKRPARYSFDDDDDDSNERHPCKKRKKGKGKAKASTKLMDETEVITLSDSESNDKKFECQNIADVASEVNVETSKLDGDEISAQTICSSQKNTSITSTLFVKPPGSETKPLIVLDSDDELPDINSTSVITPVKKEDKDILELPSGCDKDGRSWTSGPRGTLIVCPLSVVNNWVDQFEEHVDPRVHLKILVYHGSDRTKSSGTLKDQDVVITTYATVTSDFKNVKTKALFRTEWLRIVLDEGHIIRNPNAQQTKAIFELKAQRRWILTGTPIQNSVKDLWSLVKFLRVQPFTERDWWLRTMAKPIGRREKIALERVRHLMRALAMRRLKTQKVNGKPLVELPARHVYLEKITLSDEERQVYEAMQENGQVIIGRYFKQGTLLHNYGEVLAILMRLRQLCCHPRLVAKAVKKVLEENPNAVFNESPSSSAASGDQGVSEEERQHLIGVLLDVLGSGSDEECSICLDSLKQAVITPCAHVYCRPCITSVIDNEKPHPKCPLCRGALDESKLVEVPPEAEQEKEKKDTEDFEDREPWQSSAKIDALMKSLNDLRAADPSVKSVVVSQFTSLLSLLELPLRAQGFSFCRLDGTMKSEHRVKSIQKFSDMSPGSPTIILLSLKAGGVGINLTAGSRIFLMDPAWNPASEDQCFDRCHRLGQTKDVIITRFVIEDSVEERMIELQDKKRQLMQAAFDKKLSADDRRKNLINMIKGLVNL